MDSLTKLRSFFEIIKHNGGFIASIKKIRRMDDLRIGKLVGTDKYGNKYYENNYYFFGRNRWVEYNDNVGLNYDASQIPAEWFGWMHHRTDYLPHNDPTRPKYFWMSDHTENKTGTPQQFVPYSTTRPKIIPWTPKAKKA